MKQAKKYGGDTAAVSCLFKCIHCCLGCFEKTLKYINRNAYIEVAIYGYNFCVGAYKAFTLLTANVLRYVNARMSTVKYQRPSWRNPTDTYGGRK